MKAHSMIQSPSIELNLSFPLIRHPVEMEKEMATKCEIIRLPNESLVFFFPGFYGNATALEWQNLLNVNKMHFSEFEKGVPDYIIKQQVFEAISYLISFSGTVSSCSNVELFLDLPALNTVMVCLCLNLILLEVSGTGKSTIPWRVSV
jgi:hypothetical protein